MQETWVQSLGWEGPLEEGMTIHSSILAWRILMDCSLPGSSVYGILQARILEWIVMPSSRGSFLPRDPTDVSYVSHMGRRVLYHYHHLGSPGNNAAFA